MDSEQKGPEPKVPPQAHHGGNQQDHGPHEGCQDALGSARDPRWVAGTYEPPQPARNRDRDGKIADSVDYSKAPLGKSYNKTSSGWTWSATLTPGAENIASSPINNSLQNAQKSDNSNKAEAGLAGLSQVLNQEEKNSSPWFLFFTVLATTLILATAVLIIKFKLNNRTNYKSKQITNS